MPRRHASPRWRRNNMLLRFSLLAVALFFIASPMAVRAQGAPNTAMPREAVEELARQAHALLPQAKIGAGEGVAIGEEKAKQLHYPLVPYGMIEFMITRGHLAGFAAHCGMDWQKQFFSPLMTFLRSRETSYTDYQWAYVGILHGLAMGSAEANMKGKLCPDDMRATLMKEAK